MVSCIAIYSMCCRCSLLSNILQLITGKDESGQLKETIVENVGVDVDGVPEYTFGLPEEPK
jgi:hypothetical protein